jgi:hypothetical protein
MLAAVASRITATAKLSLHHPRNKQHRARRNSVHSWLLLSPESIT